MFGIGNKKNSAPPDVGEEDKFEQEKSEEKEEGLDNPDFDSLDNSNPSLGTKTPLTGGIDSTLAIRLEQLDSKVNTMSEWMKQVYERFSYISENIGEMRSMNLNNEKQIVKAIKDSSSAMELVKEVQPEALRSDYMKVNNKIEVLNEKLESNKQFVESVLEQFKDIQRKAEVFIGTEGVLKLNEDTKKELIEVQKLATRARLDADKSEQIFMELKSSLSEMQKLSSEFVNFNNSSSLIKKEIEKIKLDHSKVISDDEFADLKKIINRKFLEIDEAFGTIEGIKQTNERTVDLIEKILRMTKANNENIDNIALSIGKDNIKRVSDYENQIDGVLRIVDSLAGQINEIKKQVGIKQKISIKKTNEPLIKGENINMEHLQVPKHIVKKIVPNNESNVLKMVDSGVNISHEDINEISKIKENVSKKVTILDSKKDSLDDIYAEEKEDSIKEKVNSFENNEKIKEEDILDNSEDKLNEIKQNENFKRKEGVKEDKNLKKFEESVEKKSLDSNKSEVKKEDLVLDKEEKNNVEEKENYHFPREYPEDEEIASLNERIKSLNSEI